MQIFSAIFVAYKLLYIICSKKESSSGIAITVFRRRFIKLSLLDLMVAAALGIFKQPLAGVSTNVVFFHDVFSSKQNHTISFQLFL